MLHTGFHKLGQLPYASVPALQASELTPRVLQLLLLLLLQLLLLLLLTLLLLLLPQLLLVLLPQLLLLSHSIMRNHFVEINWGYLP